MTLRKKIYRGALLVALATIAISCGVTRYTPEGSYFLQRVKVVEDDWAPKQERIAPYVFESYVRQNPNKRLLGVNFYVWAYNLANPDKDNAWNRFLRDVGQAPIYYDALLAERSRENLKAYMNSQGYYSSEAAFSVDTTRRKKRATVTYFVEQGESYTISSHNYEFHDNLIAPLILGDSASSLIKIGAPFNATTLDKERERIANNLRKRGYYNFSTSNVSFLADTLLGDKRVKLTTIIKQYLAGYNSSGQAIMENNTCFVVNDVNVVPDFDPTVVMSDTSYLSKVDTTHYRGINIVFEGEQANVRSKVLRQAVQISSNNLYNSSLVDETYANLISIGYFKSAKVMFSPIANAGFVSDSLLQQPLLMFEDSLSGSPLGFLSCNVLCTPALTQSVKLEMEGSSTSSYYGLSVTAGYQNRNIFRGAEALDISITTGYEFMKSEDAAKRRASELGLTAGLTFPRFIAPLFGTNFPQVVQPRTGLELTINYQDRPYYSRMLVGSSWDYSWRTSGYSSYSISPVDIYVIDMYDLDSDFYNSLNNDYLKMSFETQLVAGLSFAYAYNNQLKRPSGNATMLRYSFESSGNLLGLLEKSFDEPSDGDTYHIFGIPYAQYVRSDINISRKIMLGEVTAIAARWYSGVGVAYGNSVSLPFDRLFYVGGSNSMRGWTPRMLGPGSTLVDDNDSSEYPNKVGDVKLEANLELRFPIWGNIHGATFVDVGNVWYLNSNSYDDPDGIFYLDSFYKQLGMDAGFGLRLDITFAILRLDWGIQLHNPNNPVADRWIKKFDWNNTSLNFGVGYPF